MALSKTIQTRYGVDLTYWRLARFQVDWTGSRAEACFVGYPTQQHRLDGHRHIVGSEYRWEGADFSGFAHDANNTAIAYGKAKAAGELEGGADA